MKKITLVWNRARSNSWETDWIEYLFRNIPHDTVDNPDHDQYWDNSVVIDTVRWADYHDRYCAELVDKKYKYAVIDLSDEVRNSSTHSYTDAEFVLRNYCRPGLEDHVLHIPLGYNTGFTNVTDNPPASERSNNWAFVGQRWDEIRERMRDCMMTVPRNKIHIAQDESARLTPAEMSKIYRDSIFVPAPRGWFIIDSFRVTEALEAGCIPIVESSDYWGELYGEVPPFIQINNWAQAPGIVTQLLADPQALEELRLSCYTWWTETKDLVTSQVEYLVNETLLQKYNT
jgi:hypothetical protein